MEVLTKEVIASFKDAARKLTGPKRRAFEAQVTLDYLDGNIWKGGFPKSVRLRSPQPVLKTRVVTTAA
jgi:hypothetical protein